jgi:hypothetical protein
MDLDPLDFLVDYTDPKFIEQAMKSREAEMQSAEKQRQLEEQAKMIDMAQRQATLDLTNVQAKNAMQDNTKQLMVALDKSYQEWGKLYIQAAKEGVAPPPHPDVKELLTLAKSFIETDIHNDASKPQGSQEPQPQAGPAAAGEQPM